MIRNPYHIFSKDDSIQRGTAAKSAVTIQCDSVRCANFFQRAGNIHFLQIYTTIESRTGIIIIRCSAQIDQAFRQDRLRKRSFTESTGADLRQIIAPVHLCQIAAAEKCIASDARHAIGKIYNSERFIISEHIISDLRYGQAVNGLGDVQNRGISGISGNGRCAVAVSLRCPDDDRLTIGIDRRSADMAAAAVVLGISGRVKFRLIIAVLRRSGIQSSGTGIHRHAILYMCIYAYGAVEFIIKVVGVFIVDGVFVAQEFFHFNAGFHSGIQIPRQGNAPLRRAFRILLVLSGNNRTHTEADVSGASITKFQTRRKSNFRRNSSFCAKAAITCGNILDDRNIFVAVIKTKAEIRCKR